MSILCVCELFISFTAIVNDIWENEPSDPNLQNDISPDARSHNFPVEQFETRVNILKRCKQDDHAVLSCVPRTFLRYGEQTRFTAVPTNALSTAWRFSFFPVFLILNSCKVSEAPCCFSLCLFSWSLALTKSSQLLPPSVVCKLSQSSQFHVLFLCCCCYSQSCSLA